MLKQIKSMLAPVRLRQRCDRGMRWGTFGFLVGAILGTASLLITWAAIDIPLVSSGWLPWALLVGVATFAAVCGWLWPTSWRSSAMLVDSRCDFKNRTLTALDFASRKKQDALHVLQLHDAVAHLNQVDARTILPFKTPRLAPAALGLMALMGLATFLPTSQATSNVIDAPQPLAIVQEQASLLEETMLKELKELAEETHDPELEQLAAEMRQSIDELQQNDVDQREALAQLSEMQAKLASAINQLNVQQVDSQLQQLAEALQVGDATQAASQSLQAGEYERAAEQLEKIEASSMDRKHRTAVSENLAKLGQKLGKGKPGQLSEAVQEMLEGLQNESNSQCKAGFCKAAGVCRKQGVRKRISECLGCQLNRLAACKGSCSGSAISNSEMVAKSNNPSNSAGRGASNNPYGDEKTALDSTRREENLTGISGEGPSERETISSEEGRQDAARGYNERYAEYRKQMEEVIDSEPLPLGHRKTVRRYFESIRPAQ